MECNKNACKYIKQYIIVYGDALWGMEITDKIYLRVIFRSVEIALENVINKFIKREGRDNETPKGQSGHALAWLVRC